MRARNLLVLGMTLVAACGPDAPAEEMAAATETAPGLSVYAGNYPVKYFAERIGGERIAAELPVPAGVDPSAWSPAPEDILAYQEADLILLNGADYEGWVTTATLPASKVVDTSAGFEGEIIVVEDAITHSHGPEGEHSHGETVSTTWLDPLLAVRQAEAVRDALIAADAEGTPVYQERYAELQADLMAIDAELTRAAASAGPLLAATPDYQYLERRYGLEIVGLRFDSADPMASGFWHDLEHALADTPSRLMLWPSDPPAEVHTRLVELGVTPILFEPAAGQPGSGDYLSIMRANASRLTSAGAEG